MQLYHLHLALDVLLATKPTGEPLGFGLGGLGLGRGGFTRGGAS